MNNLRIDVWSDIACPWCYVGKRRLEAALKDFPERDQVTIVWRAFELDPTAPRERDPSVSSAARIAKKYGTTVERAEAMIARMVETARSDGLDFHFEKLRSGNTFDAHRLVHLAGERGVQDAVKERLFRAYMTEGESMGDPEALTRLASDAGLDAEEARALLASDLYAAEVRADEAEAAELGIHGVPFFVLGGRYAVSGAQPVELFRGALGQVWQDRLVVPSAFEEGAVCGPDGC